MKDCRETYFHVFLKRTTPIYRALSTFKLLLGISMLLGLGTIAREKQDEKAPL